MTRPTDFLYAIARDHDRENPNPHPWDLSETFSTEAEAEQAIEDELRDHIAEGFSEDDAAPAVVIRILRRHAEWLDDE